MQWTHFISNGQKQFNKCVLLQIERFSRHKNYDFMSTPCAPSVLYIPVDYMQFTMRPKSFPSRILSFVYLQFLELFSKNFQQSYGLPKVISWNDRINYILVFKCGVFEKDSALLCLRQQ